MAKGHDILGNVLYFVHYYVIFDIIKNRNHIMLMRFSMSFVSFD